MTDASPNMIMAAPHPCNAVIVWWPRKKYDRMIATITCNGQNAVTIEVSQFLFANEIRPYANADVMKIAYANGPNIAAGMFSVSVFMRQMPVILLMFSLLLRRKGEWPAFSKDGLASDGPNRSMVLLAPPLLLMLPIKLLPSCPSPRKQKYRVALKEVPLL